MAWLMMLMAFVYVWVNYATTFTLALCLLAPQYASTLYSYGPAIFAVVLVIVFRLFAGRLNPFAGRVRSDGIRNSAPVRRLIGIVAGLAVYAGLFYCIRLIAVAICGPEHLVVAHLAAAWWAFVLRRQTKIFIGRATRPIRKLLDSRHIGMGGSAKFSGLLEEWADPWTPGTVLLGRSMYDPRWLVGIPDDRHMTTIATSRAGKGRSVIIPNLLSWPGSALVIDPKGQNAYVTALKRGHGKLGLRDSLGQNVHILDPMGEIKDAELKKLVGRFNPLDTLDTSAHDYVERVRNIADALVVPSPGSGDNFWDNAARALIAGVIDYVMMSPNVGRDERNLATVRGLLIHPDGPPAQEMSELGGLAQAGAAGIMTESPTSSSVKYTAIVHTDWLDSVGMQQGLAASDFSLHDLNKGNTTIYLVIPPMYLETHGRFLRLFVNLSLQAASEGRKGKHATLFLLDEFYALGHLQQLAKSAGLLAGYGVKLWPIIQNIGQIQELYPKNWETFLGNAGIWTAFAMNDATTARYLSERLGKRVMWRKMRGALGYEWEISGSANLRDALELSKATSRESSKLAVFTESGDTFLLGRTPYDRVFKRSQYSPDPYEGGKLDLLDGLREMWRQLVAAWADRGKDKS